MLFKIILSVLMLFSAFVNTLDVGKEREPLTPLMAGSQWIFSSIITIGIWLFI